GARPGMVWLSAADRRARALRLFEPAGMRAGLVRKDRKDRQENEEDRRHCDLQAGSFGRLSESRAADKGALSLPTHAQRAGAGVSLRAGSELAVELGRQRHAVSQL